MEHLTVANIKTVCELVGTGATAVTTGASALQGVGSLIGGTTNYCLNFREKTCYYCKVRIRRSDEETHMEIHTKHMVRCYICSGTFKPEELEEHVLNHWNIDCSRCTLKFKVDELHNHFETHHWMVICTDCKRTVKVDEPIQCSDCKKSEDGERMIQEQKKELEFGKRLIELQMELLRNVSPLPSLKNESSSN